MKEKLSHSSVIFRFPTIKDNFKKRLYRAATTEKFQIDANFYLIKKKKCPNQLRKAKSNSVRTPGYFVLTFKNEAAPVPDKFLFGRRGGPSPLTAR
jgi:hypothetical protein